MCPFTVADDDDADVHRADEEKGDKNPITVCPIESYPFIMAADDDTDDAAVEANIVTATPAYWESDPLFAC